MLAEILKFNDDFVAKKAYKPFITSKFPDKKIAIVTCMDTRLVELLPAALGIKNGDVKMIKNAGGVINDPWDSTLRSLLVAIYELGVNQIMIIGHTECGVKGMNAHEMIHLMKERGISPETLSIIQRCGIDLHKWLAGFDETESAVLESVKLVRNHPLIPADISVAGFIMDSTTGKLHPLSE
ncbi:MAG: carbonic anhydrase [Muribaculaceae bacterium]|nr:carbonic anhydrase [Muribaculaceae bacterium]